MTAVPLDGHIAEPTDAELASAAAHGDRSAFAGIYDRYADRLYDFCVGMLRDRDGAADCVQDALCIAAGRLPQLREPDKLRPWLYAIARNEALRRLRERRRESPSDELPDAVSEEPGPDTLAARTELADLIAEAAGGLSDRDRSVLELAYRHELDGPALAEALGVSQGNANKMVSRMRRTIEVSLGALLISRRAQNVPGECRELAEILDGWDGQFSILMRKRVARHIESCPECDERRRRLVSPGALLAGAPALIPAPPWLRERTLNDIRLVSMTTPLGGDAVDTRAAQKAGNRDTAAESPESLGRAGAGHDENTDDSAPEVPADQRERRKKALLVIGLLATTVIAALGLSLAWFQQQKVSITPAETSETAPGSTDGTLQFGPTPTNPSPTTTAADAAIPPVASPTKLPPPPPPPPPVPPKATGVGPSAGPGAPVVPAAPQPPPPPASSPSPSVRTPQTTPRTTVARPVTRTPITAQPRITSRPQPNTGGSGRTEGGDSGGSRDSGGGTRGSGSR